jgi:hypothetical protein
LWNHASAEARGLLRVLLLRHRALPAYPGGKPDRRAEKLPLTLNGMIPMPFVAYHMTGRGHSLLDFSSQQLNDGAMHNPSHHCRSRQ